DWRAGGYLAEALLSYLALLGFHPGDDREILSRAELLEAFRLDRVGRSGSVFDPAKLRWVNAHLLHHTEPGALLARAGAFLPAAARALPPERLARLIALVRGNLETLADLPRELSPLLGAALEFEPDARATLDDPAARALCEALAADLETLA